MNQKQRLDYIRLIASDLQSRMNTSEINIFLSGFGIHCENTTIVPSKRVYVETLLANSSVKLIKNIAEQLNIYSLDNDGKMNNQIYSLIKEIDSIQDDHEIKRWQIRVTNFLEYSGNPENAKIFAELANTKNIWDDAAAQKGFLEALLVESEDAQKQIESILPQDIDSLIKTITKNTEKSIIPFKSRRKGCINIKFDNEYDYQDYLHSLLIPWVKDIRPEEYVPKYAGTNKRVDFFLKDYQAFIEVKFVRDRNHAKGIGNELTIDIGHYQNHPGCRLLYAVVYDPQRHIQNPDGLTADLSKKYKVDIDELEVKVIIVS